MRPPVTRCIFCGGLGITNEHVFPRWSHKYMAPRPKGKAISRVGTLYLDRDETTTRKLSGQLRDWQIKCVCGGSHLTCNGGWMKGIEDRAKPILVPLILGNATRLQPGDQAIIATWAILKVMVSEYDSISHVTTHWTQRKRMRIRQLPPEKGWGVWIGHCERVNWSPEWISLPFFVPSDAVLARRGLREPTYYNANSVTQVIGKLFVQVIHSPVPDDFVERWKFSSPRRGTLFRIWPLSCISIKWPGRALTDREADQIADAIPEFLKVVNRQVLAYDVPTDTLSLRSNG